jgi:hypothetical protein
MVLCVPELAIMVPFLPPYLVQVTYGEEVGTVPLVATRGIPSEEAKSSGFDDRR